jgi:WD40 repeat protein
MGLAFLLAGCVSSPPSVTSIPAATSKLQGTILNTYSNRFPFFGVAWSPDGKRIATGDASGAVQVRDATTGAIVFTMRGHSGFVWAIAWSPDGTRIASGSWDTTVQVWDAATGRRDLLYSGHSSTVGALAWSPEGNRIASVAEDIEVWVAVE